MEFRVYKTSGPYYWKQDEKAPAFPCEGVKINARTDQDNNLWFFYTLEIDTLEDLLKLTEISEFIISEEGLKFTKLAYKIEIYDTYRE
jgi:hypothetical protein